MTQFWDYLDQLVANSRIVIDRPKGSTHPRYPAHVYPVDYGYLDGTTAADGSGIDVWIGSAAGGRLDAFLCSVDLHKRDTEIKLLIGCTEDEIATIQTFMTGYGMSVLLIRRAG